MKYQGIYGLKIKFSLSVIMQYFFPVIASFLSCLRRFIDCTVNTDRQIQGYVYFVTVFCILPLMAYSLPGGARQAHAIRGSNYRLTPYDVQGICGRPNPRIGKSIMFKILNGSCTAYGAKPWIVQLQKRHHTGRFTHHCGGTILTDDTILTAAHCF